MKSKVFKGTLVKSVFLPLAIIQKTFVGSILLSKLVEMIQLQTKKVLHDGVEMVFVVPNSTCLDRVKTFSTKEPDTLVWINGFKKESVFWDIGANIGLYSVYAKNRRGCKVYAFEPSAFNIAPLAKNIALNSDGSDFLGTAKGSITLVPIPLHHETGSQPFHMSNIKPGGALSTFGETFGPDGKSLEINLTYNLVSVRLDDVPRTFGIPSPNYIKIDVDGIEHLVLRGSRNVLKRVDSVLVEINDQFSEQKSTCEKILSEAGLTLRKQTLQSQQAYGIDSVSNQIWDRL